MQTKDHAYSLRKSEVSVLAMHEYIRYIYITQGQATYYERMTQLCLCVRLGSQLRRLERIENSASFKNEVGG
jgi:hypothetical protein